MKLLKKSFISKSIVQSGKIEFTSDRLVINSDESGRAELLIPLNFTCYKFINLTLHARAKSESSGKAGVGVSFFRYGVPYGPSDGQTGYIKLENNIFKEYNLHFLVPLGVTDAYVSFSIEGGASITVLEMNADIELTPLITENEGITCIANGGLSAYAPKNTMSAVLLALKAGVKNILLEVDTTQEGEFVVLSHGNLSSMSDGEGFAHEFTLEELKKLNLGFYHGEFYRDTKISRLEDVVRTIARAKATPYFVFSGRNFMLDSFFSMLSQFSFVGGLHIISTDITLLLRVAECESEAKIGFISEELSEWDLSRLPKMRSYVISREKSPLLGKAEEDGIGFIRKVDDFDELEEAVKRDEKCILTSIYQLDNCKF